MVISILTGLILSAIATLSVITYVVFKGICCFIDMIDWFYQKIQSNPQINRLVGFFYKPDKTIEQEIIKAIQKGKIFTLSKDGNVYRKGKPFCIQGTFDEANNEICSMRVARADSFDSRMEEVMKEGCSIFKLAN